MLYIIAMTKKPSAAPIMIRLNSDDEQQVKFIQERLSAPGMRITKSDALRRALHAFANQLRSQEQERRMDGPSKSS
jgi:hypothetical protein